MYIYIYMLYIYIYLICCGLCRGLAVGRQLAGPWARMVGGLWAGRAFFVGVFFL